MNIEKDERLNQFFELSGIADTTKENYLKHIKKFCECVEKTPTELIDESISETKKGLLLSERKTVLYFTRFRKCIKDLAPKTQNGALAAIKSFYKTFDIALASAITKHKKAAPLEINIGFIKKDDVKNLIVNAQNLRDRAILLCMATSGMARQEIINLRMDNIEIDDNNIGTVRVRRQKTQNDYVTFLSPEATMALKNYLDERNRSADVKVTKKDDIVFVTYGAGQNGGKKGSIMSERSFNKIFKDLGMDLGYDNGEGFIKTRSHALRKFFASTLENAGMPKNKVDFMMGHAVSEQDKAYFEQRIPELKELYVRYLPYLNIEKTIEVRSLNTEDAKKLDELENENAKLKTQISELKKSSEENDKLKSDIDELKAEREEFKKGIELLNKFNKMLADNNIKLDGMEIVKLGKVKK